MNEIKQSIQQKMLLSKMLYFILIKLNLSNRNLARLSLRHIVMCRLRKQFSKYVDMFNYTKLSSTQSNKIWFCWLQGFDTAPPLVKECYKSVIEKNPNMEVIFIDQNNYSQYTDIPKFIIDKWHKGIISNTHFSDILRLELLIKHGGVWTDATTFYTAPIPKAFLKSELFLFSENNPGDININIGSWFIISKSNCPILLLTRDLLYEYWKKYNVLLDYFLMHLFFKIASEKYDKIFDSVPMYPQLNCHLLSKEIFRQYNPDRYDYFKKLSFVHKLSNKYKIPKDIANTFYEKILDGALK